ncbi:hypothetical protein N7462_002647 [Penicillium macrosclerotiorum]|uniref:uncharacterized protein n=1 Tax=Penicillium macrosclerotiorum TaxID=303699 RepID=UPI0025474096|nr:uncharacterized protein N7462_002647 [Penicillium macrosclerotiorum]KAJ5693224.1 hypothetical protein N7462_002647 [Penicillium macrosclerotiorum]
MSRPSAALQQWLKIRQTLSAHNPAVLNYSANYHSVPSAKPLTLTTTSNGISVTRRSFHSTPTRNAKPNSRPAPRLRSKTRETQTARGIGKAGAEHVSHQGMFMPRLEGNREQGLLWFEQHADSIYDAAVQDGYLPSAISLATFKDVGTKLIRASVSDKPNVQAIRKISVDVDTVFRIGFLISSNSWLREWILTSCAMAKARLAVVMTQARLIKWTQAPPRNEWTELVEQLAKEGYPPAIALHAKILGLRGKYEEAFKLLENEVLPYLSPTRRTKPIFEDITVSKLVDSPWRTYALLHEAYNDLHDSPDSRRKADEATRIAALDYNDPDALAEYASIMMNEKNLDMYEQCMSRAAGAGHAKACFFLANFYYLTYHGVYPTNAERAAGQSAATNAPAPDDDAALNPSFWKAPRQWLSSLTSPFLARTQYRQLALEWYMLARAYKDHNAAFMLALLSREMGMVEEGAAILLESEQHLDASFTQRIQDLKANWDDPKYVPSVPKKILAVR